MLTSRLKLITAFSLCAGFLFYLADEAVHSQNPKSLMIDSQHDFRVSSQSVIRSTTEDESCLFCHTPHNAVPNVPLWNHAPTTDGSAPVYDSTTLQAVVTPATAADSSKMCLACHDGTVALGDTVNDGLIPFIQGSDYRLPPSAAGNLHKGIGFGDDHPFAFIPVTGSEIQNPLPGDTVKLDQAGKVQCVSCHDPHAGAGNPADSKFLAKTNLRSELCLTCHTKTGWTASSHRQPVSAINDNRYTATQGAHTGYTGVSNNACESCHRTHSPMVNQRLVKFVEEDTCYKCHDGTVAESTRSIQSDFQTKTYRHPVAVTPSVHEATESPTTVSHRLPETSAGALRHSECVDCHNSHAAGPQTASPPAVKGSLLGVSGITDTGNAVTSSQFEYQICLKCHGDSANKPQYFDTGSIGIGYGRNPKRITDQANPDRYNTRIEFSSLVAWHSVTKPRGLSTGTGGAIPDLRPFVLGSDGQPLPGRPLSASSLIYCTDCHNSDTGRNLGTGTAAGGVHGSNIEHLLERGYAYNTPPATPGDNINEIPYSASTYGVCDKCHDLDNSITQNEAFSKHRRHIVNVGASCSVCHDPHGISGGNSINNKHLVNFDLSIVGPDSNGQLRYESTGFQEGNCYLTCHGVNHKPKTFR